MSEFKSTLPVKTTCPQRSHSGPLTFNPRPLSGGPMTLSPNTISPPRYRSVSSPDSIHVWSPGDSSGGTGSQPPVYINSRRIQKSVRRHGSELSVKSCGCSCNHQHRREISRSSSPSKSEAMPSAEDLSWRRLHMSRAKLKATATTSELLSGFAMVAMVELQINRPTNVPEWLFIAFSVCTTVLVAVHIFALMISTYLLPNLDAVSKISRREMIAEAPHDRMRFFIELAWAISTVLGLFLFIVEIGIVCWVKFWDFSFAAAWAATIVVVPSLVIFAVFVVYFYRHVVQYKLKAATIDIGHLEKQHHHLDSITAIESSCYTIAHEVKTRTWNNKLVV